MVTLDMATKAVEICRANFNAKLTDQQAQEKAQLWAVMFAETDADKFESAIIWCLRNCEYFPQVKDIENGVSRAYIVPDRTNQKLINSGKDKE